MVDVVDQATRSRMMANIKGKNTRPELSIRHELHALGFRYRLHDRNLPGSPDIVLPKYRKVILIHGCFWHLHECHLFKWPSTRKAFWRKKLLRNQELDKLNLEALTGDNWQILTVWECAIKGAKRREIRAVTKEISEWISHGTDNFEIAGGTVK